MSKFVNGGDMERDLLPPLLALLVAMRIHFRNTTSKYTAKRQILGSPGSGR